MAAVAEPEYVALDDWPAEVAPIRRRLYERFGGTLPPATIDDSIATAVARFEGCRITTFVPIFVERFVTAHLEGLAPPQMTIVEG